MMHIYYMCVPVYTCVYTYKTCVFSPLSLQHFPYALAESWVTREPFILLRDINIQSNSSPPSSRTRPLVQVFKESFGWFFCSEFFISINKKEMVRSTIANIAIISTNRVLEAVQNMPSRIQELEFKSTVGQQGPALTKAWLQGVLCRSQEYNLCNCTGLCAYKRCTWLHALLKVSEVFNFQYLILQTMWVGLAASISWWLRHKNASKMYMH